MDTTKKRTITLRLNEQEHKKLKIFCAENETSMQDYISTLIENDWKTRGKAINE